MKTTTMCRWCGGEMELFDSVNIQDWIGPRTFFWICKKCKLESDYFDTEAEALAWAQQLIPFLPERAQYKEYQTLSFKSSVEGYNNALDGITATLAVRKEEQK